MAVLLSSLYNQYSIVYQLIVEKLYIYEVVIWLLILILIYTQRDLILTSKISSFSIKLESGNLDQLNCALA